MLIHDFVIMYFTTPQFWEIQVISSALRFARFCLFVFCLLCAPFLSAGGETPSGAPYPHLVPFVGDGTPPPPGALLHPSLGALWSLRFPRR